MKLHQLSVFLENKPGHLSHVTGVLRDAGVNIVTLSLADTEQFGILRLIVPDWETAKTALEAAGCVVKTSEVVATEVEDRPGGLADILDIVSDAGVNVEYMYAFTFRTEDRAVLVFRFDDPDRAVEALRGEGVNVIGSVELYGRMEP